VQSAEIAAAAVVVDAIDAGAVKFYEHFGFVPFPAIASRLFLPNEGRRQPVSIKQTIES
jgi:hypothetical protein